MTIDAHSILVWATVAVSVFNTIVLLWLGLTVLLNAERRAWGTWTAGGGLILGGLFFAAHSAAVGRAPGTLGLEMDFWWHVLWLPVAGAPYLWYVVIAWYTGVLRVGRQRASLLAVTLTGAVALALFVVANPLPTYDQVVGRAPLNLFSVRGVPVVTLAYLVYGLLCIVLSLSALSRPESSERFMGDLARRRARPWLVAASLVLLGIILIFGAAAAWFLHAVQSRPPPLFFMRALPLIRGLDLLISGLVAVVTVLTGQAIVSYEIFTGKALPRGGLQRYWRRSLILAAGYGVVVGASLGVPVDPIYRLLLATVLMTLFYALLSWRSYADREQSMDNLRPFVASERLYEHLLKPPGPPDVDVAGPFRALCDDVLGARVAYLGALGQLAPLVGPVLVYPAGAAPTLPALAGLAVQFRSPQRICVPLDPADYGGAVWAVPLWSERGLTGVLLLGEKRDGGLYTQEEIEIARATGERLIDTRASAEMARRLMALQRQRLQESQVLDRRTRRVLHDDVLPHLHTAVLMLSSMEATEGARRPREEALALLAGVHRQIANLLHTMPAAAAPEVARLGLIGALHQAIDGDLANAFDDVTWRIEPEADRAARAIPPLTAEVIVYAAREAIRNAARYGRNGNAGRPLRLAVSVCWHDGLEIAIEDDGVGLGAAEPSGVGSGQGLALHSTMMAIVGGTLTAESVPGSYTRVSLAIPHSAYHSVLSHE